MIKNQKISLFSTLYAPQLEEIFGTPEFDTEYLRLEADKSIPRTEIDGQELLRVILTERIQTGRIYFQFVDNVNGDYNAFLENIKFSNLCQEITLPTAPFDDINSGEGEIALCMLGGYNLEHAVKDYSSIEKTAKYLVKGLDNIMEIQDYLVKNSEKQKLRRSIGIGVTNFAYWMAKKGFRYDDPSALPAIDELFEAIQFYTLKASMELAKERGACEWFHKTKYSQGWLPIDKKHDLVREITGNREFTFDWEWLRGEIAKYGLRNSVVTALMPVESSSLVTNSTNGINPPLNLISYKTSKTMTAKFVVPGVKSLANKYTLAWDITNNDCINKMCGVMQYWVDQAISINHYYNPLLYKGNKILSKLWLRI
ncbi:ribonucleoside-diphosphate reductase subunit alpha [Tenacibaculum phage PTm5]|uniref:Ribonucleoside-diphosphate reductase subunit alpha n=1 Tax=Tenacibaculum phage PTm5 TaxID=2547426 RepID=A0A5S9EQX9_9CAUD|nr:ribonucleoside-diphosphate reductase subunit alpha [Tenacibaculum phage PTm5]